MANLTESSVWESGIYQLEVDDPTLGGPPGFNMGEPVTGHSNAQAQQLANRTKWLYDNKVNTSDLTNSTDPAKGAGMVGILGFRLNEYLKAASRVPIEAFGAVGDYDTATQTGTDNSPAFAAAKAAGVRVQLKPGAKYLITEEIVVYSGMDWYGDDSYSAEIHPKFATSGKRLFRSSRTTTVMDTNIKLKGFTLVRVGQNAEHGALIDNVDGLEVDIQVVSDGLAPGGAFGVSAFYPENRPSKNCNVRLKCTGSGNFGLQYGNVDGGRMRVTGKNCMREAIGIEPYALGKFDFTSATVSGDTFSFPSHGLTTGYPLIYSREGNAAALNAAGVGANYWFAIVVDANTIKLASSKENALAGIAVTPSAVVGTHRLLKCGIARDIVVEPSSIDNGETPLAGSKTGVVIITASSGGYHENINVGKISVVERNITSGNRGLLVLGAHNITVDGYESTGAETDGVTVTSGSIVDIQDASGSLLSGFSIVTVPDNVVINQPVCRQFKSRGVNIFAGNALVKGAQCVSDYTGAVGVYISADAANAGSRAMGCVGDCPNGTDLSIATSGFGNISANVRSMRNRLTRRVEAQGIYKTIASAPAAVAALRNQFGGDTVYAGQLYVIAKRFDADTTETAAYWLDVIRAFSGATPVVSVVKSSGLTSGGGASHPSFTFSIDASQSLIATPVGSTSPTAGWHFFIHAIGDISLS